MTDKKAFRIEDLTWGGLDIDDMTAGDVIDLLEYGGWGFGDLQEAIETGFNLPPKVLLVAVWIVNRKRMEGLTLEDIREVPFNKLMDVITGGDVSPKDLSTKNAS